MKLAPDDVSRIKARLAEREEILSQLAEIRTRRRELLDRLQAVTMRQLAQQYGVHQRAINRISSGACWAEVAPEDGSVARALRMKW